MPNYAKGINNIVDVLSKSAKNVADKAANPKSFYSSLPIEHQQAYVDDVIRQMHRKNPNQIINDEDFLREFADRMATEHQASKAQKAFEASQPVPEPDLHKFNPELERQADDFLREHDPAFFDELNQAMKNYDINTTNMPRDEMVEQISSQLDNYYDNDMSEAFRNAIATQSKKDFIKNLYADELDNIIDQPLNYHLSKDPIEGSTKLNFPETTFNRKYHNVPVPSGEFNYIGQHKPADYYHNALWNYVNKGSDRDAMLEEFFQDILHKTTPTNPQEKYNTINKYKNALDKRRYELDMKNKPYDKHKLNNMKAIEDYFESLRPSSFEDFESSTLSPSSNPNFEQNYYNFIRNR